MNELLWLGCGVLLAAIADWLLRFWRQRQNMEKLADARQILKNHGLTPQLYLATIGEDDPSLRKAIDAYAFTGHIITNAHGDVVGKLCPISDRSQPNPDSRILISNNF